MSKIKITDNSIMGIIYTLILAAIITFFVGITLNTFYPAPQSPETSYIEKAVPDETTTEGKAEIARQEAEQKDYMEKQKDWSHTASIIVIIVATALVTLGLFMAGKMPVLPNGILLGGLFTIFMSIVYSMISESRYLQFGVVTAALVIIIAAGYLRFVRHNK